LDKTAIRYFAVMLLMIFLHFFKEGDSKSQKKSTLKTAQSPIHHVGGRQTPIAERFEAASHYLERKRVQSASFEYE
jgi:hypothetical protein